MTRSCRVSKALALLKIKLSGSVAVSHREEHLENSDRCSHSSIRVPRLVKNGAMVEAIAIKS
ncbi:hypothetical protein [Nostoc sp.]|uniref:hypothetical protein n=1 Tax=Nostoc sp. TaxID=1180 RepID=UPI002FF62059